jgi:hypothetical protein
MNARNPAFYGLTVDFQIVEPARPNCGERGSSENVRPYFIRRIFLPCATDTLIVLSAVLFVVGLNPLGGLRLAGTARRTLLQ